MRLSAQHRFSRGFTLVSVYTWSRVVQNAEPLENRNSQGSNYYQNPYNRNADRAVADFDLRHNFITSLLYEEPRLSNRVVNQLFGHWQLGTLLSVHTGFPFTPTSGVDNSLTGVRQDRPNVIGDPYVRNTKTNVWVTPAAFVPNPAGTFGNAGYNSLRGAGFVDVDASLTRSFRVTEKQRFELRFEFFNVLNHTNFNFPVSNLSSAAFGKIQSAADPRILQFAAKYTF